MNGEADLVTLGGLNANSCWPSVSLRACEDALHALFGPRSQVWQSHRQSLEPRSRFVTCSRSVFRSKARFVQRLDRVSGRQPRDGASGWSAIWNQRRVARLARRGNQRCCAYFGRGTGRSTGCRADVGRRARCSTWCQKHFGRRTRRDTRCRTVDGRQSCSRTWCREYFGRQTRRNTVSAAILLPSMVHRESSASPLYETASPTTPSEALASSLSPAGSAGVPPASPPSGAAPPAVSGVLRDGVAIPACQKKMKRRRG